MADREKVIKGLECCTNRSMKCEEDKCPYWKKDNCLDEVEEDALELLKEQPQIVRCKDCKFWYKDECSHLCKITGDLHPANWFCADGERRTE